MARPRNVLTSLFAFLAIGAIIGGTNAKPPSRIWGGRLATGNEFSAAVTLARPGNFVHTCGGAIIGSRFVLTAGHCVDKRTSEDITVRAGIHDIRDTANVVERSVSNVFIHPNYIPYIKGVQAVQNDLAVLVLKDPLPIGGRVQKFELPTHQPEAGSYFVAGWGKNSPTPTVYQHELKTLTMTLGNCNGLPGTICAFAEDGSTCGGDSGSPLMRGGVVYGIDSAGGCEIGAPTTLTNVFHYINWVNDIISTN